MALTRPFSGCYSGSLPRSAGGFYLFAGTRTVPAEVVTAQMCSEKDEDEIAKNYTSIRSYFL